MIQAIELLGVLYRQHILNVLNDTDGRSITPSVLTYRTNIRYNSINSYAMLHVRYRLNMFGGKVDTEGRYDKKWGSFSFL